MFYKTNGVSYCINVLNEDNYNSERGEMPAYYVFIVLPSQILRFSRWVWFGSVSDHINHFIPTSKEGYHWGYTMINHASIILRIIDLIKDPLLA